MEINNRTRALARKRRKRKTLRTLLVSLLILIVLTVGGLLLGSALRNHDPGAAEPSSTAQQTQTASTTVPQTEAPQPSASTDAPAPPETQPVRTDSPETEPIVSEPEPTESGGDEAWKLLLVNADHPLPEGFAVKLKELRNGHQVDERIYPELQQMFDDARAAGIYPFINESFRSAERQQQIMDQYTASYEAGGMTHAEAEAAARRIVALPGTSEHQLGLALDIIAEYDADSTATWQWLKENAWRYGFILRYPENKEAITGISYEAWHFRYVGAEAAREITERGLCLEEYLEG